MFHNLFKSKESAFADPIQEEHERLIIKSKAVAKTLAQKNLPGLADANLIPYTEGLRSAYQSLYSRHNTSHQAESLKDLAGAEQTHNSSMREQLEGKIMQLKDSLRRATMERENLPDIEHGQDGGWKVHSFLFLLSLVDATIFKAAFSMYEHSSNLFQLFVFMGMVALFSALPIIIVKVYRATKDSPNRYFIWSGMGFILMAGWTVCGIFRSTLMKNIGSTTLDYVQTGGTIALNPLYFVTINLMLTMISTLVYGFFTLNKEEKSLTAKVKNADAKVTELERKLQTAEDQLSRIPDKIYQGHVRRSESLTESKRIGERINALYKECIGVFIEENTSWRTDLGRPACFDASVPDIIFSHVTSKTK